MIDPKYVHTPVSSDDIYLFYKNYGLRILITKDLTLIDVLVFLYKDGTTAMGIIIIHTDPIISKEIFKEKSIKDKSIKDKLIAAVASLGFDRSEVEKGIDQKDVSIIISEIAVYVRFWVSEEIRADVESAHEINQFRKSLLAQSKRLT